MFTSTTGARCSKRNPYRWVDEHPPYWILDTSVTQWPEANVFLLPPLGVDFFGSGGRRRLSYVVSMPCYWSILPASFRGLQDENSCSAMCRVNEMNYTVHQQCLKHIPVVILHHRDFSSISSHGLETSRSWRDCQLQLPVISESVASSQ